MSNDEPMPLLRRVTLAPPAPYRLDLTCTALARFPRLVNRWDGVTYRRLFAMEGTFVAVSVHQTGTVDEPRLALTFRSPTHVPNTTLDKLMGYVERMFGLTDDLAPFLRHAERDAVIGPL